MILRCLHVFYGGSRQNLHHLHVYSGMPRVNRCKTDKMRVDKPESWHTVCLIFNRVRMESLSVCHLFVCSNESDWASGSENVTI